MSQHSSSRKSKTLFSVKAIKVGASLCVGVLPAGVLHAQAQSAPQEVLVQSGRIAQKQFDAPASIFALDRDAIAHTGAQVNLSDALSQVPGVVALNRNNYAQDAQISIRGFGSRAAFGLRGIRLITDGIPATIPDGQGQASTVSLTSAERIEVLTGPLAQLYGNASGGVIQTFTREAGDRPEAQAQVFVGSDGLRRYNAQWSQRSGKVGIVADYSSFETDGHRANSGAKRTQLNSVITVDATPDTRVKVVLNLFDMPYANDPLGLTAAQLAQNRDMAGTNAVSARTRKTVKQDQIGAVFEHSVNADLGLQARVYTGTRDNLQFQANSIWTGLERQYHGLGLQARGKARIDGLSGMNWVVGYDQDMAQEQRQGGGATAGEKNNAAPTRNELNKASNGDFFAQANWLLNERWTVVTGARKSQVTLSSRDDIPVTPTNPDGSGSVRYSAVNPVLGVTWHATDRLNVYLNHGKGLETPTMAEAAYSATPTSIRGQFNPNLLASRSQHLELGTKWLPSADMRLDAALFRIKTDDEIVAERSANGQTAYANASQTLRQGLELSLRNRYSPNWRSQVSATLMRATYEGGTAAYSPPAGNHLPGVPEQQLWASLQWSQKGFASAGQKAAPGTEASVDWVARSRLWATDANTAASVASGYGLINTRVRQRYALGPAQLEAYAGIDNLLNRETIGSVIVNQAAGQFFEPGLPRSWVLGVQARLPL